LTRKSQNHNWHLNASTPDCLSISIPTASDQWSSVSSGMQRTSHISVRFRSFPSKR
jgi:hypothetical protein